MEGHFYTGIPSNWHCQGSFLKSIFTWLVLTEGQISRQAETGSLFFEYINHAESLSQVDFQS